MPIAKVNPKFFLASPERGVARRIPLLNLLISAAWWWLTSDRVTTKYFNAHTDRYIADICRDLGAPADLVYSALRALTRREKPVPFKVGGWTTGQNRGGSPSLFICAGQGFINILRDEVVARSGRRYQRGVRAIPTVTNIIQNQTASGEAMSVSSRETVNMMVTEKVNSDSLLVMMLTAMQENTAAVRQNSTLVEQLLKKMA